MKTFDLEKALKGEPLVTRDGREVTNFTKIGADYIEKPCAAYVKGSMWLACYTINGRSIFGFESDDDLFMAEKPKIKLWIAISKKPVSGGEFHYSSSAYYIKEHLVKENNPYSQEIQLLEIEIEDS